MSRVPHAAHTLLKQLQQRYKNPTMTAVGDPDGFGVRRSVEFDKTSSKYLVEKVNLDTLGDARIADVKVSKAGILTITFSGKTNADRREEFPLDAAETVNTGSDESDESSDAD